jgi:anti-sigma B factor antagonist
MTIEHEDVTDSLRRIRLSGRLDIAGTDAISHRLTALASVAARRIVVDLSQISFLASFGIRELISNAKAQQSRGGKLVIFLGDNDSVKKTLETTGVDVLIPLFTDSAAADAAALA